MRGNATGPAVIDLVGGLAGQATPRHPRASRIATRNTSLSPLTCLLVAIGGAIGTLARYALSVWATPLSRTLPWGTIGINVTGSFLIGAFGTLTAAHGRYPASDNLRLLVIVGFCGGYTTFSSFSLQTLDLLRGGAVLRAAINVVASVALCVAAVAAGHLIALHMNGAPGEIAQTATEELG